MALGIMEELIRPTCFQKGWLRFCLTKCMKSCSQHLCVTLTFYIHSFNHLNSLKQTQFNVNKRKKISTPKIWPLVYSSARMIFQTAFCLFSAAISVFTFEYLTRMESSIKNDIHVMVSHINGLSTLIIFFNCINGDFIYLLEKKSSFLFIV